MCGIIIILGFLFTFFSGGILAYLSVATMIGPWMAPTIALLTNILFKGKQRICGKQNPMSRQQSTAIIQAIGSVGGAIATGIGFALPTMYFLDRQGFNELLAQPIFFCVLLAILCLTAGAFGITLGTWYTQHFIVKKALPFPVSQLTYNVIAAQNNRKQGLGIFNGVLFATTFAILRDGIGRFSGFIPKTFYLFTPEFAIALWPTIWAIGYAAGMSIAAPLSVGLLAKYLVLLPLNYHALYSPVMLFQPMNIVSFTVAFCSGMVVSELILGLFTTLFTAMRKKLDQAQQNKTIFQSKKLRTCAKLILSAKNRNILLLSGAVLLSTLAFLTWLKFSFIAQIIFLAACIFATYQICFIGGSIGLIQYGRFSTYILIPMYLLFNLSALQLTIVCVFFNICAATASDLLFDLKTGDFAMVTRKRMWTVQWVGLIGTALTIGLIFYLLFTNLQLGSPDFFAQRSQAKALLLQSLHFDFLVVSCGFVFGLLIKKIGFSPTMVFGGIVMPNSISLGLIIGALLSKLPRNKETYQSFCAGVFASESLWILAGIAIKML